MAKDNTIFQQGKYYIITEFKKGYGKSFSNIFKDHIYISRKSDNGYLFPRLDSLGRINSGIHTNYIESYREATKEEIIRYRKLKKPFDINDKSYIIDDINMYLDILELKFKEDE